MDWVGLGLFDVRRFQSYYYMLPYQTIFFLASRKHQECSRSEKKSAERIFTERIDKPHRSVTKLDNG